IRIWATSDAGSAADRVAAAAAEPELVILARFAEAWAMAVPVRSAELAAAAAEPELVILARFAEAWAMAVPVRSAGLAAAAASSRTASDMAVRVVDSAAARAVRA